MGGCQNYGPFLGTLNIRCRIIMGIQKGTIILTTTHVVKEPKVRLQGGMLGEFRSFALAIPGPKNWGETWALVFGNDFWARPKSNLEGCTSFV